MATKVKLIADNAITTTQIDTSSLDSHFSGGTGVTYSSGEISIGQAVHSTDSPTFADLTLTGNLNITGDLNSYNVTDLDVTDQTITLGAGQTEALSGGSGIIVDGSGASILWDETNDEWDFNKDINVDIIKTATGIEHDGDSDTYIKFLANRIYSDVGGNRVFDAQSGDVRLNGPDGSLGVVVDTGGNVGIGTSSPAYKLDVAKSDNTVVNVGITNANTGTSAQTRLRLNNSGSNFGTITHTGGSFTTTGVYRQDGTYVYGNGAGGLSLITGASQPLYFATGNTERMRIDSSGNVGIGSTSPDEQLEIDGKTAYPYMKFSSTNNTSRYMRIGMANSTDHIIEANGASTQLLFKTTGTERMRIDSLGKVIIKTAYNNPQLSTMGYGNWGDLPLQLQDTSLTNTEGYVVTGIGFSYNNETTAAIVVTDEGGSSAQSMSFVTGTSADAVPRMTIDQSGNVGIGTDNPGYQLDLRRNDTGTTPSLGIRQIGTGDASMAFQTTTSPYGFIIGVDASDGEKFKISTGISDIAADTKLAIDTSGNTVIRGSSSNSALHVVGSTLGGILLKQNAQISYTPADEANFQQGITFENSGSGHAFSIGYGQGGVLKFSYFDNGSTYSEIAQLKPTGDFYPAGSVIMNAGEGISFAATSQASGMSSEVLDDYEEGTWTPTLSFGNGTTGITYSQQNGTYTKIGNIVCANFTIVLSNKGSSGGTARVDSLPYSVGFNNHAFFIYSDRVNFTGGILTGYISAGSTITLYDQVSGSNSQISNSAFENTSYITGVFTYRAA